MKKYYLWISVSLILAASSLKAQAQENSRWQVSLSGGWALPVGAYQKIAPEKAVANRDGSDEINGFDKEGNSAAEPGYAFNVEVYYRVWSNWHLTAMAGYSLNTVNTEVINRYLNNYANENWSPDPTILDYRYGFNHQDYQASYYLMGLAYRLNLIRWQFSLNPQMGIGNLRYPDYSIALLWTTPPYIVIKHEKETPSSQSFMLGSTLRVSYQLSSRINAGMACNYLMADFPYQISLRAVPGGSDTLDKSDVINYRQVQLGFQLGYSF